MKRRTPQSRRLPELNIIPMIDIMFFLLVFFMLSTLYMIDLKTLPVQLPRAAHASDTTAPFTVTLKTDGSLYLNDQPTDMQSLLLQTALEQKRNRAAAVVIRAEKDIGYQQVVALIDKLKGAGVTRFGLATDKAAS